MTDARGSWFVALSLLLAACGGGNANQEGAEAPARPASDESPVRTAEEEPSRIQPPPEAEVVAEEPAARPRPKRREPTREAEINPPVDAKLADRIKKTFGESCRLERICGELLGIDCQAAVDGPYYYVKPGSLEKVSTCGGACMGGKCTNCPPAEWDCAKY